MSEFVISNGLTFTVDNPMIVSNNIELISLIISRIPSLLYCWWTQNQYKIKDGSIFICWNEDLVSFYEGVRTIAAETGFREILLLPASL